MLSSHFCACHQAAAAAAAVRPPALVITVESRTSFTSHSPPKKTPSSAQYNAISPQRGSVAVHLHNKYTLLHAARKKSAPAAKKTRLPAWRIGIGDILAEPSGSRLVQRRRRREHVNFRFYSTDLKPYTPHFISFEGGCSTTTTTTQRTKIHCTRVHTFCLWRK